MNYTNDLRWDLFDGEGEGSGSAEASAFMDSIGASEGSEKSEHVEYGLPEDGAEEGPVGEDDDQEMSLEEEFESLIGDGGVYEQLYNDRVSAAIQNRFKNQADWQNVVAGYENALAPLIQHYGLEIGDIEGLGRAINDDDSLYERAADEEGITTERYRENLRLQLEAQRGRTMMEEYERQQYQREMFEQWDAEAAELQQTFPNFDLVSEIESNEEFEALLDSGVPVRQAFLATHVDDILSGAENYAVNETRQRVASSLNRAARRPVENGMVHGPASVRKSDPSKLTDEDMDEIFKQVREGKSFRF